MLSLAIKGKNGGSTMTANYWDPKLFGLNISTEGVCSKCGGTHNVESRNAKEASGFKNTSLLQSLGCNGHGRVHGVRHHAGDRIRASRGDFGEDVTDDASISLVEISMPSHLRTS